ncbi:cell wall-binding repeat-containing protein [Romboutsia sp. MSSM.1001216sp_RTP31141st1_G3_RTP31141_220114]|uniref:cell wall-binding repeat-containing protein n=1 Tax=unclassified Romboutsia TaxID=2626894 RepID=UPI0031B5B7EE
MLKKKNIAMAMAVATVAQVAAPIVASADEVKKIEISAGEIERIAKVEVELQKAAQKKYTNNKWIQNSQGSYFKEYVKYEKNENGTFEDVPVYKIEKQETATKTIIKVTDRGHRVGFEGEYNAIVDFDEKGKNIESKLVAEIVINKVGVNEYNVEASQLFKTNGKLNDQGLRLQERILEAKKLGGKVDVQTIANKEQTKTGVKVTVSGAPNAYNMVVNVWGRPANNTTDSMVSALAGVDRCETAVQVSQEGWKKAENVILVGWNGTPDGLTAAPLATAMDAPILVSNKTSLGKDTKLEIDRLEAKNVYVVGGENTVPQSIINELKAMGVNVERISGSDRMRTSFEVAKKLDSINDIDSVYFAGGYKGEGDALSIASVAARSQEPVILLEENRIADDVKIWLKGEELNSVYIIGGTYALNENIQNDMAGLITKPHGNLAAPERIQGANVQETNAKVIERFQKDAQSIFIAQDANLVDALAAGPLAAKKKAALVLATNNVTKAQENSIKKTSAYKDHKPGQIGEKLYQVGHGVQRHVVRFIESIFTGK